MGTRGHHICKYGYHKKGINRYFTLPAYSLYPGNSFLSVLSSNMVRIISKIIVISEKIDPHNVPNAMGVARNIRIYPAYPGCLIYL